MCYGKACFANLLRGIKIQNAMAYAHMMRMCIYVSVHKSFYVCTSAEKDMGTHRMGSTYLKLTSFFCVFCQGQQQQIAMCGLKVVSDSLSRDLPGPLRIYALATPGPPAMGPKLAEAFLYYVSFLAWPSPHLNLDQFSCVELALDLPISCGVAAPRNMQSFRDVPFPGPKLKPDRGVRYVECYQNHTCGKWPRLFSKHLK